MSGRHRHRRSKVSSKKQQNNTSIDSKDWRRPGQAFRQQLVLQDQIDHSFSLDPTCSIDRYYQVADKVYEQFVHHAIDTRDDMVEAYVIGMRLVRFYQTLPTHPSYDTMREQERLENVQRYLQQIARLVDEAEHARYVRTVLDSSTSSSSLSADVNTTAITERLDQFNRQNATAEAPRGDPRKFKRNANLPKKVQSDVSISRGSVTSVATHDEEKEQRKGRLIVDPFPVQKKSDFDASWDTSSDVFNTTAEWNFQSTSSSPTPILPANISAPKRKSRSIDNRWSTRNVADNTVGFSSPPALQKRETEDMYSPSQERALPSFAHPSQPSPTQVAELNDWMASSSLKDSLLQDATERSDQITRRRNRLQPFRDCVRALL